LRRQHAVIAYNCLKQGGDLTRDVLLDLYKGLGKTSGSDGVGSELVVLSVNNIEAVGTNGRYGADLNVKLNIVSVESSHGTLDEICERSRVVTSLLDVLTGFLRLIGEVSTEAEGYRAAFTRLVLNTNHLKTSGKTDLFQ